MPYLYQLSPDGSALRRSELAATPLIVGRDASANVCIEDIYLSDRHFTIERRGNAWCLRDLDSRNGTWLNGRRISQQELALNDRIRAGRTHFRIEAGIATMIRQLEQTR